MPRTTKEANKKIKEEKIESEKKVSTRKKSTLAAKSSKKTTPVKEESTTKKIKTSSGKKVAATKSKKTASAEKKSATKSKKATSVKKDSATKSKKTTSVEKESSTKSKKTASAKKESATKSKKTASVKKESAPKKDKTTSVAKNTVSKVTSKRTSKAKSPSKKTTSKKEKPKIDILEYYDLPYRYNQTVVKVLAQTPNTLFVYWDISDADRKSYIEQFGNYFFENTKPVLIITNKTMNYSFEIEINDFANCWYFNINDEKCEYLVELGRRPKENTSTSLPNNYLYITSSNEIESPNGHILFEKEQKTIYFRNVKTNEIFSKDIANLNFLMRIGRVYKIYDIYHKLYKNDELINPSYNPSSKFF